jgi:hypothetical protein
MGYHWVHTETRKDLSAGTVTRHMDWLRKGSIPVKALLDNVVCRPIVLRRHREAGMASPSLSHGHTRRLGSRLFAPDWWLIEAAFPDEKRAYLVGLAAVAETLRVVQALSELCAVVDRVRLVVFLLEHWLLVVAISRQILRAQCQDCLRVDHEVVDPVGYPSCLLRQIPRILRPLPQSLLLLLLLQTLLRPRRPRPRNDIGGVRRRAL